MAEGLMGRRDGLVFEIVSRLGRRIRLTKSYWEYIVRVKHPSVEGLEKDVEIALKSPVEVRRSSRDPSVFLYYGKFGDKLICVVAKHLNEEGFVITVYLTRRVSGDPI